VGIIAKQSKNNVIFIYAGASIGFLINIFYGNYFSSEENGVLSMYLSIGTILGAVSTLGFAQSGNTFFPTFRDKERGHNGFFAESIRVGLIGNGIVLLGEIIYWILLKNGVFSSSQTFLDYFFVVPIITLSFGAFFVLEPYLRFNYNTTRTTFFKEFVQKGLVIFLTIPVFLGILNFDFFILAFAISLFIIPFGQIHWLKNKKLLFIKNQYSDNDLQLRAEVRRASVLNFLHNLFAALVRFVDIFIINYFLGSALTGVYVRNFYFSTILQMIPRATSGITLTLIADHLQNNNMEEIDQIYKKTSQSHFILSGLLFLLIWFNRDFIFYIFPEEYHVGVWVIFYSMLANMIISIFGTSFNIIAASTKYYLNLISNVLFILLNIILATLIIPKFGITGGSVVSMLSVLFLHLGRAIIVYKKYGLHPFSFPLFKGIVLFLVFLVGSLFMPFYPEVNIFLFCSIKTAVIVVVYTGLGFWLKASPELVEAILGTLRRLKMKF